ncbi:MAG: tripartite tricarboxylate transporter permease [Pseudomonadota bacterium]
MLEAIVVGAGRLLDPPVLLAMAIALPIGLVVGLLPGLSGLTALAFLIPFTYGMDPLVGLTFLLAGYAAVSQGGSVTAILLGVPGELTNAATVIDGYPLAQQGRAGYGVGAALMASAAGGLFGCLVLAALLPVLQPIVLAFGSPESFFLALAGVVFIGVLASASMVKGLIAGALGIFLSLFGYDPVQGIPRFWMGIDYMLDGFRLIPIALGLFAIPEILSLTATGAAIAATTTSARVPLRDSLDGAISALRHGGVLLRSAAIGTVIGIMPGVGGAVAPFVAYAAAKQTAAEPGRFGKGAIEGVIAPESSNNAKEGGALVPTLALGIPGSASMAILLGAFLILGLQPGPEFLVKHMDIAFALALVLAIANVAAAAAMLVLTNPLARLTLVPGRILAPLLLVLVVIGAYSVDGNFIDVVFVFVFGALGVAMTRLDYSRPALLLGFVLGELVERYFHISSSAYGAWFLTRPLSLAIVALLALAIAWPYAKRLLART